MSTLWEQSVPTAIGFREAQPRQVHVASDLRRIDVREYDEFVGSLGHLPGAEHVPLGQLEQAMHCWGRNETIVLICRSGHRSAQACALLMQHGFCRLINMTGGMFEYVAQGLPISREGVTI